MLQSKSYRLVLGFVLLVALVFPTVVTAQDGEGKVVRSAFLPGDLILDPSLASDANSIQVLRELMPGLTDSHEETAELMLGIATEYSVSDDGLVYTFKLMQELPWVRYEDGEVVQLMDESGNPRYVTANDVVYGAKRTLDPTSAADYAYVLAAWVVGGVELNGSEATGEELQALKDAVGVRAVDDYTVEFTSPVAAPAIAPLIYGMWMARPEPSWLIEEFGDAWTRPENIASYGPYALAEWEYGVSLTIVKNPFWPGTAEIPQATVGEFTWVWLDEPAQLASYEAGELDWLTTVPLAEMDRLRAERAEELSIGPGACTYYYGFNVTKAPFDNVHARRAFSMAIDRDIVVQILNGGQQPAGFFSRPNFGASPKQEDYPDFAIWSDAAKAQEELQAYFDETGTTAADLPPITLMHNTSAAHATIAQAVQQMWKDTLGVDIQITTQEFDVYQDTLDEDSPQVWRLGWCLDYPDPNNFLNDVFHTGSELNYTNWTNPEFDDLVEQAMSSADNAERIDLYAQAENLLVNQDAAIAPIYYYTEINLTAPAVTRTYSITGQDALEKWDIGE